MNALGSRARSELLPLVCNLDKTIAIRAVAVKYAKFPIPSTHRELNGSRRRATA